MSTPTVIADIQHPAARSTQTKEPTDLFTKYEVVRVFSVTGLTSGADNQASTLTDRALSTPGVPLLGSLAPGTAGAAGAVCINRMTLTIPATDDGVYVLCTYKNPLPGQPVAFIVSDDTSLSAESVQLHPSDKSQMTFTYQAPNSAVPAMPVALGVVAGAAGAITQNDPNAKPEQYQANFKYSRPIRKVSITGYVVNTNLNPYRAAIGSVNAQPWLGYDVGFWRFDRLAAQGILFGNIQKVTVEVSSRVNENWMSWEIFNSPDLGRRITVPPSVSGPLIAKGYFYYWQTGNGIICAGLYPTANFTALFGFGGGATGGNF